MDLEKIYNDLKKELIKTDSILNHITNKSISEKELNYISAIMHIIKMISFSYNELLKFILHFDIKVSINELMMVYIWSILDSSYRLKKIIAQTPGIKQKDSNVQKLIKYLKNIEDIRNLIQHYDKELPNFLENNYPMIGSVCWAKIIDQSTLNYTLFIPGYLKKGMKSVAMKVRSGIFEFIDDIKFGIGNYEINISELIKQIEDFVKYLESHIESKVIS